MATTIAAEAKRVPGPSSWLPGASFLKFRRDPLAFFTETQRTYGDIARFSFGPQQVFLVSHPDWIEDVLVTSAKKFQKGIALQRAKRLLGEGLLTSEGQAHLRQRRTIQPLFHRQQVQRFAEAMVTHALRWRDSIAPDATIDVTDEMAALTLAIVGETLFSSNVQGDADEVREALTAAVQSFGIAFLPGLEYFEKLPLPMFTRVRKARERLDRVIHRVIAERRDDEPEGSPHDAARPGVDAAGGARSGESVGAGDERSADSRRGDDDLPRRPRDHRERDGVDVAPAGIGTGDRAPAARRTRRECSTGGRQRWRTCRSSNSRALIVAESMRLYPPAWTMGRRAIEPHTIGGHTIEPGALVIVSQWIVHHDPRWWTDPDTFNPDRWSRRRAIGRSTPTSRLAAARASASANRSRGPRRSCCWRRLRSGGRSRRSAPPTTEPRITLRPKGLRMRANLR